MPAEPVDLAKVLVIEDDPDLRRVLKQGLGDEGFSVRLAHSGAEALTLAREQRPDLVVLDIGLPDADGRDICQALRSDGVDSPGSLPHRQRHSQRSPARLRRRGRRLPDETVRVRGARRAAACARRRSNPERRAEVGDLRLDPLSHRVGTANGDGRSDARPSFACLGALASRPGEALRRREMVAAAWPAGAIVNDNTLDVYIGRLRRKIAALESSAEIQTVHGVGYRLNEVRPSPTPDHLGHRHLGFDAADPRRSSSTWRCARASTPTPTACSTPGCRPRSRESR